MINRGAAYVINSSIKTIEEHTTVMDELMEKENVSISMLKLHLRRVIAEVDGLKRVVEHCEKIANETEGLK